MKLGIFAVLVLLCVALLTRAYESNEYSDCKSDGQHCKKNLDCCNLYCGINLHKGKNYL